MEKNSEKRLSKENFQFSSFSEKENIDNRLSKKLKHRNTLNKIPRKSKNQQNNFLSAFNNYINNNKSNNQLKDYNLTLNNNESKKSCFAKRLSLIPERSISSMNQKLFLKNMNLDTLLNMNKQKRLSNLKLFPSIRNTLEKKSTFTNAISLKNINRNKDEILRNKFFGKHANSVYIKHRASNLKNLSEENNLINKNKEEIKENNASRKSIKKNTFLNTNKKNDLLNNERNLTIENGDKVSHFKEKKTFKNPQLLYSQKSQNFIFKIYKADDFKKKSSKRNTFKKKSTKFCIKDYLNKFDPKKYINKIKNEMENKYIENHDESKNVLLHKSKDFLEYLIFKSIKLNKNKQDILEKIIEKNTHFISKEKNRLIQEIINEILSKIKIKHKNIVVNFYIKPQLKSQIIDFHIYIKLSIMTHVLRNSEREENVYFINLIKHLLYSHKKRNCVRYPLSRRFGEGAPIALDKFMQFNNDNINYLNFCSKLQQLDCETIFNSYKEKHLLFISKKKLPVEKEYLSNENKNESLTEKDYSRLSTIEAKIKKINQRSYSRKKTIIDKIRLAFNSKLENINLSKNIINLRMGNIEEALKVRTSINLKILKNLFRKNRKEYEHDESSEQNEGVSKNNKQFTLNNNKIGIKNSIKGDNEEIHTRDKILLFNHFLYYVEFAEYDKLLYWLNKSSKYMDFNYKFKNGDTLLHLCVRNSVPLFIYKFLIAHGLNINIQNDDGDTALHLAVKGHKYQTIDYLIKLGASEYIYNKLRQNCWECF